MSQLRSGRGAGVGDLGQEAILTQLKLDIHTAHQTLLEEFIEQALEPVLWEEAQRQAEARQRRDARSTARGREGEPLSTDVKELYETKVVNLQRETILHQLLHQGGYFLYHPQERVIISVAYPFRERRMQAAYEQYCRGLGSRRRTASLAAGFCRKGGCAVRLLHAGHDHVGQGAPGREPPTQP